MLIHERIQLIIKANRLSSSEFADKIGIKRSNLSHVLNGRNKPGLDFLSKIIENYPNVDASWLLTGVQQGSEVMKVQEEDRPTYTTVKTPDPNSEAGSSEIERIIIFHKNGTFSTYSPSEV